MMTFWGLVLVDAETPAEEVEREVVRAMERVGPEHADGVHQEWTSYRLHMETLCRVSEWDTWHGWFALMTPNGKWATAGDVLVARPDFDLRAAFAVWRTQMMDVLATHMRAWSVEVHMRFGVESHFPWEEEEPLRPGPHERDEEREGDMEGDEGGWNVGEE